MGGVPTCFANGKQKSIGVGQAQAKVEPKQDRRPIVKCKICDKPHAINIDITLGTRRLYLVHSLSPSICGIIQIGVGIEVVVKLSNMEIIMIIIATKINRLTYRSIFEGLIGKVRM